MKTALTKQGKLDALKKKNAQIKAQIQKLEASEKTQERKRDTRRKILVGAYFIDQANETKTFAEIVKIMDGYLKRNSDRVLFDLEPIEDRKPKVEIEQSEE